MSRSSLRPIISAIVRIPSEAMIRRVSSATSSR